jgi:hypothetical protein
VAIRVLTLNDCGKIYPIPKEYTIALLKVILRSVSYSSKDLRKLAVVFALVYRQDRLCFFVGTASAS